MRVFEVIEPDKEFKFHRGYVVVINGNDFDEKITERYFLGIWALYRQRDAEEFYNFMKSRYPSWAGFKINLVKCEWSSLVDQYLVIATTPSNPVFIDDFYFFAIGPSPEDIEDEFEDEIETEGPPGDLNFIELSTGDGYLSL